MIQPFFVTILLIFSFNIFAHGGDKPGPHGGKIMMPGNFHTELVMTDNEIQIYLLDIKFEKPMIENSEVKIAIEHHGKEELLTCTPSKDAFIYKFKDAKNMISKIKVHARRDKSKGTAIYELKNNNKNNPHSGH